MLDEDLRPIRAVGERLVALEKDMESALDGKDANRLMDFSREGDDRLRREFVDRLAAFRNEMREHVSSVGKDIAHEMYKDRKEMEDRIMSALTRALAPAPEKAWLQRNAMLLLALALGIIALLTGNARLLPALAGVGMN